jgi:hypothetical protein
MKVKMRREEKRRERREFSLCGKTSQVLASDYDVYIGNYISIDLYEGIFYTLIYHYSNARCSLSSMTCLKIFIKQFIRHLLGHM